MIINIQNSYSTFTTPIPGDVLPFLTHLLTYKNEIDGEKGQLFFQAKMARKYNNSQKYHAIMARIKFLEDNEFVCLLKGNMFPTGLLNIVQEGLKAINVPFNIIDSRQIPYESVALRWNNKPYPPRYYQDEMIKLGSQNGRGVFEAAVGSGKSLVMAYLVMKFKVNTLIIVPSRGLGDQLYNDFCSWFGSANIERLDAQKIRKLKRVKPISIVTVQSLGSLQKTGEFKKFAEQIEAIHCDELHHAGATTYTNLLKDLEHVYYRFGYTGTFLRNDSKTLEMWSFLSNVLFKYPAHQAIQEGYLTPMEVVVHGMNGKQHRDYQKEYENNYCGNPEMLQKIFDISTGVDPGSQILILVSRKDKSGKIIHEYLNTMGLDSSYISGDNSETEITQTIRDFNDKKVKILIGSSVIGEGIDVRSTDHLIMAQGGKSTIVMVQAIGRAIRLFEGKKVAYIHDFQFKNTKFMERHFDERLEIYNDNFCCPVKYV
jgi:superfamily II DNA or RNA helicase